MANEIIIGRNVPDNDTSFKVPAQYNCVSGKHAKIYRGEDGKLYIEDTDSTGGTYVNRHKVKRSPINVHDAIYLGGKAGIGYQLPLQAVIEKLPLTDEVFNLKMNQLKYIWDKHQEIQNNINLQKQKAGSSRMMYIMLAGGIGTLILTLAGVLGVFSEGSIIGKIATAVISIAISCIAYLISDKKIAAKMTKLNEDTLTETERFQLNYECPDCHNFLMKPWNVIAAKGECPCCHRKFTPRG